MSEPRYKVIFSGEPLPSVPEETLKTNLSQLFGISQEEAHCLLFRGDICLKRNLDETQAIHYLAALQKAGAACRKEAELALSGAPASEQPAAPQEAPTPARPERSKSEKSPAIARQALADEEYYAEEEYEEDERFAEALNPYSAEGRIGRVRYLAWSMAALLSIGIPLYLVTSLLAWISASLVYLSVLLFLAAGIALLVCAFRFTIQRLHDLGFSAWFVLLIFVPVLGAIVYILLHILPGKAERNIYGPPPPPDSFAVQILALLWIPFLIFTLLPTLFRALFR